MTQPFDFQSFAYAKQFADNAFKAQAAMLQGMEQAVTLQLGVIEQQSRSAADFLAAAGEVRDHDGARSLWDKGVALGRVQAEQAAALTQGLVAVGRRTIESIGALAQPVAAANDVSGAASRKAAAK